MSAWTEGDPISQTQACQSVKGAPQRYRGTETGKGATQRYRDWKRCNTRGTRGTEMDLGVIGDGASLV